MRLAPFVLLALMGGACKLPLRHKADGGPRPTHAATRPAGYVTATVVDVVPSRSGDVVLLQDDTGKSVLPIFVGGTEALAIKLRMEGKKYKRPLTHDLLGDVMHDLGGSAVKVQVDDLRDDTYIGSAFIEKADGTMVELDARPSDCIALSLGEKVPIFVKKQVFDVAGVPKDEIEGDEDDAVGPSHKKGDPLSL